MCQKYYKHGVGEGTAEVGAVDVRALLFRDVDLLATRTVDLHPRGADFLAHSHRQNMLPLAENSRTDAEHSLLVLILHNRESFRRGDVPGVDEAVNIGGLLIDGDVSGWGETYL